QYARASPQERRMLYHNLLKQATLTDGKLHLHWVNDVVQDIDLKKPPDWLTKIQYSERILDNANKSSAEADTGSGKPASKQKQKIAREATRHTPGVRRFKKR